MQTIDEIVNSMTSEQYIHMLEVFFGPVDTDIAAMSDDELLAALEV